MGKQYKHQQFEEHIYKAWEKSGGFKPSDDPKKKPYTIIMPPPNANDPLHIGHAMFVTVEDILIRYHRMLGRAVLWLPGTDHAGIETQFVFEKKLAKKKQSRFDFDRETLYKMIWDYVQENSNIAVNQLKKLGASCDWSRFKFTLDPDIVSIVLETFQELNKKGLIYRDLKLVNYCTKCGTAFSELEIKHREQQDPLYYISYRIADEKNSVTVATVRPETIFADVAIAIHPKHKKAKELIGEKVVNPLTQLKMPIIADEAVDPEFGTGMLKVTPAHDFNDFEIGKRHNLPRPQVIGHNGKVNLSWLQDIMEKQDFEGIRQFHWKSVVDARKLVARHLQDKEVIKKIDKNYTHDIGSCYRCGRVIEPLPLPQFFVKVESLTKTVLKALKEKKVKIYGAGHGKILKHWLENLKDWNISRQIVWGIQLPVWYNYKKHPDIEVSFIDSTGKKQSNKIGFFLGKLPQRIDETPQTNLISSDEISVGDTKKYTINEIRNGLQELRAPVDAEYIISTTSPGSNYIQETDTFDTWFSSGQWPFATLMASHFKNDYERFYPTQVMETGYDILVFWVMRMLMFGLFKTGKVPFEKVYLHGLVRDEKGQKMSKSKGNVISPLDVIEKYGADALRMALVMSTTAGRDSNTGEGKIRGMRNLTNKIWNATRFITMNLETKNSVSSKRADRKKLKIKNRDKEFKKKLSQIVKKTTKQLEDLKVGLAAETVYSEFWHWFCDKCIEDAKDGKISQKTLVEGLATFLVLLHPFVPFVTEACWKKLYEASPETKKVLKDKLLMNSSWAKS